MAKPTRKRKSLKPLIDGLDLDIGNAEPIASLRMKLGTLREQAAALESDCEIAETERDDFKTKLEQANLEITRLSNELAEWQKPKSEDQRIAEEGGFWAGG